MSRSKYYTKSFYATGEQGSLGSARIVVPILLDLMAPKRPQSAVDFGCGLGTWLKALQECGVSSVLGLDGNYVDRRRLLIRESDFRAADLEKSPPKVGPFDLAVSMEVAEHLPERSARPLVERLTEAAPVVLFSAAVPGQDGTHHINSRWPSYWAKQFDGFGFKMIDPIRPRIFSDQRVEWWYRQNAVVFVRREALPSYPQLAECGGSPSKLGLEWVHVDVAVDPDPVMVLGMVPKAMLRLLWRAIPLPTGWRSRIRTFVLGTGHVAGER